MREGGGRTLFYTLDGIRGIAAILVVLGHGMPLFAPMQVQESYLAVDVFFVLSGVVIAQAYGERLQGGLGFRAFAWIRLVRIMPLYWLGTALGLAAALAGLIDAGPAHGLPALAALALFMIPNPGIGPAHVFPLDHPAWSLPLELAANAAYAAFPRRLTPAVMACIMAVCAVGMAGAIGAAHGHSLNFGFWPRSFPFGLFRVGYSFFAGVLLFGAYPRMRRMSRGGSAPAWGVLALVALALLATPGPGLRPYFDFILVTLAFPALVLAGMLVQPLHASARVFRFLGLTSYALYTLHWPLVEALQQGNAARFAPISGVAVLAALLAVCWAVDRVYDMPARQYLRRLGERRERVRLA